MLKWLVCSRPWLAFKGGHPQFKSAPLQLRNIADNQIDCGVADWKKVAELWLQTFKIWLPQFRNFPQSPASLLLSCPFSSAQDGFKSQQKIFLESSVSLETETCLKGTVAWDFLPLIFSPMNRPDSTAENVPKISELKLSSCGLEVADFWKNCDCGIAELRLRNNISSKVAELQLRKCFLQVAELRLRTQKKLRVPTSASFRS